jgi:hypothetical protein
MTEDATAAGVPADVRAGLLADFRWNVLIRPRLEGLTDDEYLWEPAENTLTVRPGGSGGWVLDPVVSDPPLGNIAWRMAHLTACLASHPVAAVAFGSDWLRPDLAEPAGSATEALTRLDAAYANWHGALERLSDADLGRKLGPAAGPYADDTLLAIVFHVYFELMQRGADLCLLRDLYSHIKHEPAS